MHIPHILMMNMICIHHNTSSILMTDVNDKWPWSRFQSADRDDITLI